MTGPTEPGWEKAVLELYEEPVRDVVAQVVAHVLHAIELRRICPAPWAVCLDPEAADALARRLEADRDYHQELEVLCPEVADGPR